MAAFTTSDIDLAVIIDSRSRDDLIRIAVEADRIGISNFWVTETMGRDAFSVLTSIALRTNQIGLGTGITNIWARTPSALAQATATVMEVMGDRTFNLGIGGSGKSLIEKLHGIPFDKPMGRLEEYVRIIDHIFTTGNLPGPMEIFTTQEMPMARAGKREGVGGLFGDRDRLKIFVAGLTPRSLATTGKYADGWLPIWPSKSRGVEALETLREAADSVGRPMPDVSSYIYGVISDDPRLIQLVRDTLAFYVAANGVAYQHMFERMGYENEVAEIIDLWQEGKRDEARTVVNQAMLEDTSLIGELPAFEAGIEQFRAAGVERPILQFPPATSTEDIMSMLAKLAPAS